MKKHFSVKASYDKTKKFNVDLDIKDSDFYYLGGEATYTIRNNYKELKRLLISVFGKENVI